ncbi:hypothetical protein BDN71DRAFT_1502895 [Pleurotus eryngii]|uniref:Uncharacterized protein n=1 Tax=Pleurotus eryngii TaxID=5323 RepID=A0A9P6DIV9_PLEER|nr:hypothetical protein BDN71DRAFT_1502895 [Pleurotus eryngii]
MLWEWFNKSEQFFCHKSIAGSGHVEAVAWGMSGVHAVQWLLANSLSLAIMDWDVYQAHMCVLFLPSDWEHTTRMNVLQLQQGSRVFINFSLELMAKNNLLVGIDSFFNDKLVHNTLEANMERELAQELNHENTNTVLTFWNWLDEVKHINERCRLCPKEIEDTIACISLRSMGSCPTATCPSTPTRMEGVRRRNTRERNRIKR